MNVNGRNIRIDNGGDCIKDTETGEVLATGRHDNQPITLWAVRNRAALAGVWKHCFDCPLRPDCHRKEAPDAG